MRFFVAERRDSHIATSARRACKKRTINERQRRAMQKSLFFSMKMRSAHHARAAQRVHG
jgi:hypothetical protein